MKNISVVLLVMVLSLASSASLFAQESTEKSKSGGEKMWQTLSRITFKKQYDEMMGFKVDVPVFSPQIQELDGKEITIKGYIIPVEGYKSHTEFVFSAFPYNMCFFCGGAGPETVMEVTAKSPVKYTAEAITLKGILQLNSGDINRLIYSMTEVELVK